MKTLRILKAGVSGLEGEGGERGGLNEKCPPQDQAFEPLVPSCLERLWGGPGLLEKAHHWGDLCIVEILPQPS